MEVRFIASEAVLLEKSNLNLTGNTEDVEELGTSTPRVAVSELPTQGSSCRTDASVILFYFLNNESFRGKREVERES